MDRSKDESRLYEIIGNLYKANAPLVFKGALVTKLILFENSFDDIVRKTVDIDANWVGEPPTMEQMVHSIASSLGNLRNLYKVQIKREYGEGCSAGLVLVNKNTGRREVTIDIDVKEVSEIKIYHYGETKFKGVLVDSIFADKISAISTNSIFRRTKDILDIYALSQCVEIKTKSILEQLKKSNRKIGRFNEFLNEKEKIEHAFSRLKRIVGKPEFQTVYNHVKNFISPFMEKEVLNLQWNKKLGQWEQLSQINENENNGKKDKDIEDEWDMEI